MQTSREIQEKLWSFTIRTPFSSPYLLHPKERGKKIDLKSNFPKEIQNFVLELGSGWGEVAIELASKSPHTGFLLMEKKINRIIHTEKLRKERELENLRYMTVNFQWFFDELLEKECFHMIFINFPDPWPKRKHHKNRVMQKEMLEKFHRLLKPEGILRFATDYGPYARKTISLFRNSTLFEPVGPEYYFERPEIPRSFFEQEKREENKRIYFLDRKKVTK